VVEIPSYEARRVHGLSNLSTWQDGYRVLRTIVRERLEVRARRRGVARRRLASGSPIMEALSPATNGRTLRGASADGSR
jgi:hypothetical protein